ncbi:MAG: FAD binding domain-containing protein [Nannocystis sp.]|nr:FAD binding domain-containing protein [Nannocystis sp.]MBA3546585.1 FAD binding domain-containing protein [Nannocystis sp.]
MIEFPNNRDALLKIGARSLRAGGTDLQDRRRLGLAGGPLVDLRDVPELETIAVQAGALQLGSRVRIATLASNPEVSQGWPGLATAAGDLATPQIRNVATIGGNLLQSVRCWYFRRPGASCFQVGGNSCDARTGDHSQHACIDLGPCIAPHPSTLAVALLAYDAELELLGAASGEAWPLAALYGDGSDPGRAHRLPPGNVLLAVKVPAPLPNERSGFQRTSSRARGDWPLAEAVVRVVVTDGAIRFVRVAVGGVANVPLRLAAVEQRLLAQRPTAALLIDAAGLAGEGTRSPPGAAHKLDILRATIQTALERALAPADLKDPP